MPPLNIPYLNTIIIDIIRNFILEIFKGIEDVYFEDNDIDLNDIDHKKWLQIEYFTMYVNIDHVIAAFIYNKNIGNIQDVYFEILTDINEAQLLFDNIDQIKFNHTKIFLLIQYITYNMLLILSNFINSNQEINTDKVVIFFKEYIKQSIFFEIEKDNDLLNIYCGFSILQKQISDFIPKNFIKDHECVIQVF